MNHSIENYLATGATNGERNRALFAAACQCRDEGAGEGETLAILEPRAMSDGLEAREIETTVASAFKGSTREPAHKSTGSRATPAAKLTYRPTRKTSANELPKPLPDPTRAWLKAAFENGENICVARGVFHDGRSKPESTPKTFPLQQWLKLLDGSSGAVDRILGADAGIFVCVNPLVDAAKGRKADNVTYRHCLVEFDGGELLDQWATFVDSNLPITSVVYSGGKSLHALVRVEAKDAVEYKARVEAVFEWFKSRSKGVEVDGATTDAPRLSRLPGATREGVSQDLLALRIGAKDWLAWELWRKSQDLPDPFDLSAMLDFDASNDPDCLIGDRWLCRGGSVLWVGESGVGKSVLTTQAALVWATGQSLFGVKPKRPLRSLVVQAENSFGDLAEGFQGIMRAFDERRRVEMASMLKTNLLFVSNDTWTGETFCENVGRLIDKHKPDLVWIDPLLAYLGGDISSNEVVGRFLRNWINPISAATGCSFMVVHHTGKPPRDAGKQSRAAMSYAGIGASELVNWARAVVVLQSQAEGGFALNFTKRGRRAGVETVAIKHSKRAICWERDRESLAGITLKPKGDR